MGPWLLKPTNIIIIVLMVIAASASLSASYLYSSNMELREKYAAQKRENELYVQLHNEQIKSLVKTITAQNTSIDNFKRASDAQVQEMGKVQRGVDDMRVVAEQQLAELRKRDTSTLTCDQSIDFLKQQAPAFNWKSVK